MRRVAAVSGLTFAALVSCLLEEYETVDSFGDAGEGGETTGARGGTGGTNEEGGSGGRGGSAGNVSPTGGDGGDPGSGGSAGNTGGTSGDSNGGASTGGTAGRGGATNGGTAGNAGGMTGGTSAGAGSPNGGSAGATGGSGGKSGSGGSAGGGKGGSAGAGGSGGTSGTAGSGGKGSVLFQDDFELGSSQWTPDTTSGWTILSDGSSVYGIPDGTMSGPFLTGAGNTQWTDVRIEARMKITAVGGESTVYYSGICARVADPNTHVCFVIRSNGTAAVRLMLGGNLMTAPASGNFLANTWYTLRLDVIGSTFTGYVNGVQYSSIVSGSGFVRGGIALTVNRLSAIFDDVVVYGP